MHASSTTCAAARRPALTKQQRASSRAAYARHATRASSSRRQTRPATSSPSTVDQPRRLLDLHAAAGRVADDRTVPPAGFDPQLSRDRVLVQGQTARATSTARTEQRLPGACPPDPQIDYLAKDYASFRRLMLDRLAVIMPDWRERNPADLGIVAGGAARLRRRPPQLLPGRGGDRGVPRHGAQAGLGAPPRAAVDYLMHDGCNARAWVRFGSPEGGAPAERRCPTGRQLLGRAPGQPRRLDRTRAARRRSARSEVFETLHDPPLLRRRTTRSRFYTWGDEECCLPAGATRATLCAGPLGTRRASVAAATC